MKAFDTITPSHWEKEKSLHQTSKRQFFIIEKKQSIQIPIKTKVQIQAISHEVRKPKVHIIKTKQPHIHILESRGKNVLGFNTESEQWGHHAPVQTQNNNAAGGLFSSIRNASLFQRHSNQLQGQQSMNQNQQIPLNQPTLNPFQILKQKFSTQPQPLINQQPLRINTLGFGIENHMNTMQQQQQQNAQKAMNLLLPLSQPMNGQQKMSRGIEIDRENLQQSHVQRVELQNIPGAFPQQQQLQQSLADRLVNFFKSFRSTNPQQQNYQQNNNEQILVQNLGYNQNQQMQHQNPIIIEKSQVQNYIQPENSNKETQRKVRFQQSIVEEYHADH